MVFRKFYALLFCTTLVSIASSTFALSNDVVKSRFPEAVRLLMATGAMEGYEDGSFRLEQTMTRAQFVTVVLRLFERRVTGGTSLTCFEDVSPNAWYAPDVCRAKADGLIAHSPSFYPDREIRFAEALKLLVLAANLGSETEATPWYAPYLEQASVLGLDTSLAPDTLLSRDDVALLIFQLLKVQRQLGGSSFPSSGCSAGTYPTTSPSSVKVAGLERNFISVVSNSYDHQKPQRLVIAFHGRTSPNTQVRRYYGLEADAQDTIFLYPSALHSGNGFSWGDAGDMVDSLRDFALFDALLDTFASSYCIDLTHVFVVGHSLGASFANQLACARGDRIRAAGTLGGGISTAICTGKTAAIVFHNPDDRLVPFKEGERVVAHFLEQNGLPSGSQAAEPLSYNCERFGASDDSFPLVWCPHGFDTTYDGSYYPHHWPRGTGGVIMAFFDSLEP